MRYFRGTLTFVKEIMPMVKGMMPFIVLLLFMVFLIFWFNSPSQQISGVVAKVEYDVKSSSSLFGSHETKHTIVRFEDGRVKVFSNIREIINEGKFNTIHYNRDDGIVCVKIK